MSNFVPKKIKRQLVTIKLEVLTSIFIRFLKNYYIKAIWLSNLPFDLTIFFSNINLTTIFIDMLSSLRCFYRNSIVFFWKTPKKNWVKEK